MNAADSHRLVRVLQDMGGCEVDFERADIFVVVTCSVRKSAEDRVHSLLHKIAEQKKKRPGCVCILTGCMATKRKIRDDKLRALEKIQQQLPMVDIVLDIQDLPQLPRMLQSMSAESLVPKKYQSESYLDIAPLQEQKHTAYIPISTGCNNFCTYCIVPYTRGREVSRPMKSILDECRRHIDAGVKDIFLLGQNVDSYGKDIDVRFSDLLHAVNDLSGDFWVHFISNNPQDMGDDELFAVRDLEKLQPYIHLPLQAGSDDVLRRMGRKYSKEEYYSLYQKVRETIPSVAISTDIIVGFPGESKENFEQTAQAFRDLQFDMAYLNRYSPRPPAPSTKWEDDVSSLEKKRREHALNDILARSALERNKQFVGRTLRCIVKESSQKSNNTFICITPQLKPLHITSNTALPEAQLADVRVTHAESWILRGVIL